MQRITFLNLFIMLKQLKTPPSIGDEKIIKKFAYFPIYEYKKSDGKYYFCWWEHYFVKQQYIQTARPAEFGEAEQYLEWINIDRWIE